MTKDTCESFGPLLLTTATTIDKTMFITRVKMTLKETTINKKLKKKAFCINRVRITLFSPNIQNQEDLPKNE